MSKKTFSNSEKFMLQKNRDVLPPLSESPFGAFPDEWSKRQDTVNITVKNNSLAAKKRGTGGRGAASNGAASGAGGSGSAAGANRGDILIAHTGIGGMTSSTFKGHNGAVRSLSDGRFGDPKGPGKAGAFDRKKIPPTEFRHHYERGDLPLAIQHAAARTLQWKVDVAQLDYHHYLPIFFDGLRELEEPFSFVALQGSMDLLEHGGAKILPTVPQLIMPLKTALNTRHPAVVVKVLKIIQKLVVSGEYIGEALVPYYRQLLPVFNLYKNRTKNLGDKIDFAQHKNENLSTLVNNTLNMLERYGGEDAFINIKYMVPTYESCM